ncbi:uncharacterized protein LY79DRAFT_546722 [Colletotrichum navitas]|uniref:Uncharacterized protein n=1 Tax=Colletotrichum navitas TaxID=681940 RepID=A0AAD8V759_9PEZI|nr:uncharacterized protein LY79DRAFT_546722 [Colletotrichum navitas]KAK1595549.1 hypothetical protein LY79DRAFT_546722 [Colletotrichum navitas]
MAAATYRVNRPKYTCRRHRKVGARSQGCKWRSGTSLSDVIRPYLNDGVAESSDYLSDVFAKSNTVL